MANRCVLAIDNSIDHLNVALAGAEGLIDEVSVKGERSPSQVLPETVASILGARGLSVSDITDLVVTVGPGSFTGIRVSLSFCKGIRAATGTPARGVPTLDALSLPLIDREGSYLFPVIDARKSEVFGCLYQVIGGRLKRLTQYAAMKPADVPGLIRTPCIIFGTGSTIVAPHLLGKDGVHVIHSEFDRIRGAALADLRLVETAGGGGLKPIYGRRSEAEISFNVTID